MLDYTLLQFGTYVRLAQQRERRGFREAIVAARIAQTEAKDVRAVLQQLE